MLRKDLKWNTNKGKEEQDDTIDTKDLNIKDDNDDIVEEEDIIVLEEEEYVDDIKLSKPEDCLKSDQGSFNIIGGARRSGKTNLLKTLLKHNYHQWNKIVIFCPTLDSQEDFKDLVEKNNIIKTEQQIEDILKDQQQPTNKKRHVCIVIDDFIGSSIDPSKSKILDRLASSSRHYRISVYILTQDLKKISPVQRDNCNNLYITKVKEHSLRCAYELSSNFKSFKTFKNFIDKASVNYQIILMNLSSGYDKQPISVFRTELLGKVRFLEYRKK